MTLGLSTMAHTQSDLDRYLDELVSKAVRDGQPYTLDSSTCFPERNDIRITFDSPTVLNTDVKLFETLHNRPTSGNFAIPVTLYGLMFGQHQPADGQPYRLARLDGKRSRVINLLTLKATLAGTPLEQINAILWRLQAGISLPHLPKDDQTLIHTLISEYEDRFKPDYIDGIHSKYRNVSLLLGGKSFEDELDSLGPNGKEALFLYRSRKTLLAKDIALEDLPERLGQTIEDGRPLRLPKPPQSTDSPWAEVSPGIYARLAIYDGIWKQNWLEVHIESDRIAKPMAKATLGDVLGMSGIETGDKLDMQGLNAFVGYSLDDSTTPVLVVPKLISETESR